MAQVEFEEEEFVRSFPSCAARYNQGLIGSDIELAHKFLQLFIALHEPGIVLGHESSPGETVGSRDMAVLDPQATFFVDLEGTSVEEDHIFLILTPLEFLVLDKILFMNLDLEVRRFPGRKYFS
jgi:hypothetical protein